MKHLPHLGLICLTLLILASCGATNQVMTYNNHVVLSYKDITDPNEQGSFITNQHPELVKYYKEGLLRIRHLREYQLEDGKTDWDFKYGFRDKEIEDYGEQMEVLKSHFPEIYNMYCIGKAEIEEITEYVEEDTGKIKYNVEWKRLR